MDRYRPWFYIAATYNALWSIFVVIWPNAIFDWLALPRPNYPALFQCIGMMVGVYAIGYWLVARDPVRYGAFVAIGLAGKVLGVVGAFWAASKGELPWAFLYVNVSNDIVWLPAFVGFMQAWRRQEGWREGEQ